MNEDIILRCNIKEICYETVKIESTKRITSIIPNVINFYIKYIIGSKNIYHGIFLKTKLSNLINSYEKNDIDIKRKLLVEIYLYIALCNKLVQDKKPKQKKVKIKEEEAKNILINELKTTRRENIINSCIDAMYKEHIDTLWEICIYVSEIKEYTQILKNLFEMCKKKELIIEAYNTINKIDLQYSNQDYRDIIFQCMLKINYIYNENDMYDKHMQVYLRCLNCPVQTLTNTIHLQYNRISYIHEDRRKSFEIKSKQQQEYMYFEKVMKN